MISLLPPSQPAVTIQAPPPRPLDVLRREACERLDGPVFPASFSAPCERCGKPRLSAVEVLCVDCACEVGS